MSSIQNVGGNLFAVKRQNRAAVLRVILGHAPISRQEISVLTGVRPATVSNIINELVTQGYVEALGEVVSSNVGRRSVMLGLRQDAATVAAVDFRLTEVMVALSDLRARVIDFLSFPLPDHPEPSATMDTAAELLQTLLARNNLATKDVLGVGVGCIGLVDYESGTNLSAPSLGWRDVPVGEMLKARLALPVVADNRVRAMALAERFFGYGQRFADLAVAYLGWGVGSGLIIGDRLLRGSSNLAGELGHIQVVPDGLLCNCGSRGCLETVASGGALMTQARHFIAANPRSPLARLSRERDLTVGALMAAAGGGDADAHQMVVDMAHYLGAGIATLVTLFNPDAVVLCGPALNAGDVLLDTLRQVVRSNSMVGRQIPELRILASSFGKDAEIIGAATLALEMALYDPPPFVGEPRWRVTHRPGER